MVELENKANAYSRSLSGGMKRRLLIAKALVHQPPIIILDEPTAGVDVQQRKDLWDNLRLLNKQGVTIILTTHYLIEAEEMLDYCGAALRYYKTAPHKRKYKKTVRKKKKSI